MVLMQVVLWHRGDVAEARLSLAVDRAGAFLRDLLPTLPRPYYDREGHEIGKVVGARLVTTGSPIVMVVGQVELR